MRTSWPGAGVMRRPGGRRSAGVGWRRSLWGPPFSCAGPGAAGWAAGGSEGVGVLGEGLDHEAAGSGARGGEFVVGVGQGAGVQGQAAAADAAGEVVAQADELGDARVEFVAPLFGDGGPVGAGGGAVVGEGFEGLADAGQGHADALGDADEGDPAQGVAAVAALVAAGAAAVDEPLAFVEVQGGDGDSGAFGDLADGEFLGDGWHGAHLRSWVVVGCVGQGVRVRWAPWRAYRRA